MANTAQAKKRARQAEVNRARNGSKRSRMRTAIKAILAAIKSNDKDGATAAYKVASPIIDRMSGRGLIHKNKAARYKSRLNAQIKAL